MRIKEYTNSTMVYGQIRVAVDLDRVELITEGKGNENTTNITVAGDYILVDAPYEDVLKDWKGGEAVGDRLTNPVKLLNEPLRKMDGSANTEKVGLSIRTIYCLDRYIHFAKGIDVPKVADICDLTIDELPRIKNFGKKSENELLHYLGANGLKLKEEEK